MWEAIVVQPIFNVLVAIYALIPGHSFGLAIILFTILARIALYPVVKKQLYHSKALRELQPEIKEIKKKHKGDRQQEMLAVSALYKEREVKPAAGIGFALIQIPIFLALYQGITRITRDPQEIINTSYGFVRDLPWMKELAADISLFSTDFYGLVDLGRKTLEGGSLYFAGLVLVVLTAYIQFVSSKQLIASQGEKKSLREVFRAQAEGEEVDQADISAAVAGSTIYIIPGVIMLVSLGLVVALPLYWLASGVIGYFQQRRILNMDAEEALNIASSKPSVVKKTSKKTTTTKKLAKEEAPKKLNAKQKRDAQRNKAKTPIKKTGTKRRRR